MKLNVDPLMIMFITLGVIIAFVGFNISTSVHHNDEVKLILKESERQGEARTEQIELIKQILQQQGNLSKDARQKIIDSIIRNEQEVIPQLLNMTAEAHKFWSFLRENFNEEYIKNEYRQYAQSNETQEKLNQILSALNGTYIPVNNTDREIG